MKLLKKAFILIKKKEFYVLFNKTAQFIYGYLKAAWYKTQTGFYSFKGIMEDVVKGNCKIQRECPVCQSKISRYLPTNNRAQALCPVCGSHERQRVMQLFLSRGGGKLKGRLLHFAPERCFYEKFKRSFEYYPVDFNPDFPGIIKTVDITSIEFESNFFDYIICMDVLEHIGDEKKALAELRRVLKPGGTALIKVPVDNRREKTLEDSRINTDRLRKKYYGLADHVRQYGRDAKQRFAPFFEVKEVNLWRKLDQKDRVRYGLARDDVIYVCTKK